MSLMVIYYLQVTLDGHGDNLSLGDLFLNLLDSVVHFSYLMPAIGNQPRQGFSFMGYLKGVQSKLGIQLDLSSKEALHTMKRVSLLCENGSKMLHHIGYALV